MTHTRRRRQFRFEEIWTSHTQFPQFVEEAWTHPQLGNPMLQLCRKIKDTGAQLLTWDRTVFGSRKQELEETRSMLQSLLQKPFDPSDQPEKLRLSNKLNDLISIDEI